MSKAKPILIAIAAGLLLFLTLGAWSLSSPVGSSPDDDFHLASIWCGQGEREGLCGLGSEENRRQVPDKVITGVCYAMQSEVTPVCQGEEYLDEGFTLVETNRVNTGNQYPSGFYFATSLLTNDNIAVSTILVRLANSALFSALAVLTWFLVPSRFRFSLAASVSLTFVPVGLFFIASTNPTSWALISGGLALPAMLGYFATSGWRQAALGAISAVSAFLAFGSRGDASAFVIVAMLAAMALAFRAERRFWLNAILPAALIVAAASAFLGAGQVGLAMDGEMGRETEENPTSKIALAALNLVSLPKLWAGVFGEGWGLGWLDTGLPAIVPGIGIVLTAGVLFAAFRTFDWRRAVALTGIAAANLVVPTYILVQSGVLVGSEVQPRYIMALVTMFIAAALAPSAARDGYGYPGLSLSALQVWIIAGGLAASQAISLFVNLKRYVTTGSYNLDGAADWWWAAGPSPFTVFFIGTAAFAGFMALLAVASLQSMRADSGPFGSDEIGSARRPATAPAAA